MIFAGCPEIQSRILKDSAFISDCAVRWLHFDVTAVYEALDRVGLPKNAQRSGQMVNAFKVAYRATGMSKREALDTPPKEMKATFEAQLIALLQEQNAPA